jgi:asparagine synthase (glutamine-hydrolysing)
VRFEPDRSRSAGDLIEELRALLDESVRLRLVSDVPLGAFLSGGLDSSAVVATMARHVSGPLKTFTIGFKDQAFDESAHARRVAREFGTEHHELILSPTSPTSSRDRLAPRQPFGDSSAIPTYMVSKLAAREGGALRRRGTDLRRLRQVRDRVAPARLPAARSGAAHRRGGRRPLRGLKGRNYLRSLALDGPRRYLDRPFSVVTTWSLFLPEVLARMGDVGSRRWRISSRRAATGCPPRATWTSGLAPARFSPRWIG